MSYKKEKCYLTQVGNEVVGGLIALGVDEDLALEVAHIIIKHDELYDLERMDHEDSGQVG